MKSLSQFSKGVNTDNSRINQPDGTVIYAFNGVQLSEEGDLLNYSNEKGTLSKVINFPIGFKIIGGTVLNTDFIVFLVDPVNSYSQVGIVDLNFSYTRKAPSNDIGNQLNLSINHQISCVARKLFTGDRIVYFCDWNIPISFINLDNPPLDGDIKDISKLVPNQNLTNIDLTEIQETSGNLHVGVYQIVTRYKTSSFNATSFGIPSQPIPIVKGLRSDGRNKYDGEYFDYGAVQKSIKVEISNVDTSYPYLEVVVIYYENATNTFTAKALPLINITSSIIDFSYNGTESNITSITQDELNQLPISYSSAKCVTQKDNILLLSNLRDNSSNYDAELQSIANNIRVNYKIDEVEFLDGSSTFTELAFDINGSPYLMETPTNTLYVVFNGILDQASAEDITNYNLSDNLGGFYVPNSATIDPTDSKKVILVFAIATIDLTYSLGIPGDIFNYVGDTSYTTNASFTALSASEPFEVTGSTIENPALFNDYKSEFLTFNQKGYQREEVYSLMMGVAFKDGSTSFAYHIPASNVVYRAMYNNPSIIDAIPDTPGVYIGNTTGELGVYRSTLQYPLSQNYPLSPDPYIRHHKMPTLIQEPHFRYDTGTSRTYLRILGLEFTFMSTFSPALKDNIQSIIFYRQRRDRPENRSVIAQGLINKLVRTANDYNYSDATVKPESYVYKKMPFFNNTLLGQIDCNPPSIGGLRHSVAFSYDDIKSDSVAFFSPDTIFNRITRNDVVGAELKSVLKIKGKIAALNFGLGSNLSKSQTKAEFGGVISIIPPVNRYRWSIAKLFSLSLFNNYYKEDNTITPSSKTINNASYIGKGIVNTVDSLVIDNTVSGKYLYLRTASNISDFGTNNPVTVELQTAFPDVDITDGTKTRDNPDIVSYTSLDTSNNLFNIIRTNTSQYGIIAGVESIPIYKTEVIPLNIGDKISDVYGGDTFISKFAFVNKDVFNYKSIFVDKIGTSSSGIGTASTNWTNNGVESIAGSGIAGMDLRALSYFFVESVINTNYRHRYRAPGATNPNGVKYYPFDSAAVVQAEDPRLGDSDAYNTQYSFENIAKLFYTKALTFNNLSGFECRTIYSEQAKQDDIMDNYRIFLQNSYHDIPKNTGGIWNTFVYNNIFYIHTPKCLWRAFVNDLTQQVNTIGEVIIGTGGMFPMPSKEVTTADGKGYGGTISQFAGINTPFGYVFPDVLQGKVFLLNSNINELSQEGIMQDMHRNLSTSLLTNGYIDNPSNPSSAGIIGSYDHSNKRYVMTKRGTSNDFTWSYSLLGKCWSSLHSYKPHFFLSSDDRFFGFTNDTTTVEMHQHNVGDRGVFYSQSVQPFKLAYIINIAPTTEKRLDNVCIQSTAYDNSSNYLHLETFKSIRVRTQQQDTGVIPLTCLGGFNDGSNVKKVKGQFQIAVPHNGLSADPNFPDRMSGHYMEVELTYPNTSNNKIVLNFIENIMRPVAR
jgi:hypothetical protein